MTIEQQLQTLEAEVAKLGAHRAEIEDAYLALTAEHQALIAVCHAVFKLNPSSAEEKQRVLHLALAKAADASQSDGCEPGYEQSVLAAVYRLISSFSAP